MPAPEPLTVAVAQPVCAEVVCRKTRLHGAEGDRFTPGEKPAVLELEGRRLGLAICADAAFPEHAEQLAALGIAVYVASTLYGDDPVALARRDGQVRDRAAAHRVWGVLATSAGASGEYPRTSGGSGFWAPGGALVAQAGAEPGAVVRHDLSWPSGAVAPWCGDPAAQGRPGPDAAPGAEIPGDRARLS
ncbi:carbon-nitrogen hydrolase family protein [Kitasatospora sp. NPDC050467]|uniref:carbon-nitrogen hydrolase family protein n=1 Tax=Kitasatospora sp. NPDC050467 TaxID=3364053 RepID=UPI0037B50D37